MGNSLINQRQESFYSQKANGSVLIYVLVLKDSLALEF